MYTAVEIARYIINRCIRLGKPVSNLQLQKILYYVQGEFMRSTDGEILFEDDIMAWKYGPVVPNVYYAFNNYSSSDINIPQEQITLEENEMNVIDPIIDTKSNLNAWKLVEDTHLEFPWRNTYYNDEEIITREKMQEFFCN